MAVAAAVSFGSPFGTDLLLILPLLWGLSIFGVEFAIHMEKQPQTTEFGAEGIRFSGPNLIPRMFRWRDLTRVQVRTVGSPQAPDAVVFVFRQRLLARWVPIDIRKNKEVAECAAAFVARYAPGVRRTGHAEVLRWDSSLTLEGGRAIAPRRFPPSYWASMGFFGPFVNLYFAYAALVLGLVQDTRIGWAMTGAYVILGASVVAYSWLSTHRSGAFVPLSHRPWTKQALLAAGGLLVALQGLLAYLFLS